MQARDRLSPLLLGFQKPKDLGLVVPGNGLAIVPVYRLRVRVSPSKQRSRVLPTHTTGRKKLSLFFLNLSRASLLSRAPLMMRETPLVPTYSSIVWTWSVVGGSSVMLSSNGSRVALAWLLSLSLAWSVVGPACAFADSCLSRLATRVEAGELAL